MAKILPYIEQNNLYQQAQISLGASGWPQPPFQAEASGGRLGAHQGPDSGILQGPP
jgi:hypothetical protein